MQLKRDCSAAFIVKLVQVSLEIMALLFDLWKIIRGSLENLSQQWLVFYKLSHSSVGT